MNRAADAAQPYLSRLRQGGVRVTPNRRRVLECFLVGGGGPWTLSSLHRALEQDGPCDQSSVYRALEALRGAGILEEFRLPGERQTHYSLIRSAQGTHGHHHHHIVCGDCGEVSHLDLCFPAGWIGKVEGASGFRITEHHLEFRGICEACDSGALKAKPKAS